MISNGFPGFFSPGPSDPKDFSALDWRRMESYSPKAVTELLQSVAANGRYASIKTALAAGLALSSESEVIPRMYWVAALNMDAPNADAKITRDHAFALQLDWVNAVKTLPRGPDEIHEAYRRSLESASGRNAGKLYVAAGANPLAFSKPSAKPGETKFPVFNAVGREVQRMTPSVDSLMAVVGANSSSFPPAAIMDGPLSGPIVELDALEYAAWVGRDQTAAVLHRLLAPGATAPLEKLGETARAVLLGHTDYALALSVPAAAYDDGGAISMAQVALRYIGFGARFSEQDWRLLAQVRLNYSGKKDVPLAHVLAIKPSKGHEFSGGFRERAVLSLVAAGFDVNTVSSMGTLLHRAAAFGLGDLGEGLLELGADPALKVEVSLSGCSGNLSARDVAVGSGHQQMVHIIDAWSARRRIHTVLGERAKVPAA